LDAAHEIRRVLGEVADHAADLDREREGQGDEDLLALRVAKLHLEATIFVHGGQAVHRLGVEA
jgi:hypothetical protein